MAERSKASEKPDLTPDPSAPPPGEPPDTVAIYGILGESGIASSVRLYLDRGLSTYYDIPIEGIAGREKVPADRSPLGVDSTLLFVRKGIRLVVHHVDTRTVEDEFLSGDFTAPGSFTPAPGGGAAPGPITIRPTLGFTCTYLPPTCPQGDVVTHSPATVCTHIGCFPTHSPATVCTHFGACGIHTRPGLCPLSAPPHCPTVQICVADPNALVSAPPHCPSVQACHTQPQFGCPPLSAPPHCPSVQACHTQPQFGCPVLSAPPHCPSVGPQCHTAHFGCVSTPPNCPTVHLCPTQLCGLG